MDLAKIREILGWSSIINYGLLIFSGLMLFFAHDWIYTMYQIFFTISVENFEMLWIVIMGFWKILIFFFNIIPYFVLRIVDKKASE